MKAQKVENLGRGEFGEVERRNGFVLDKRRDPANGLTYYVVFDERQRTMWTSEEKPWDFRRAARIFNDLASGAVPTRTKEEKFGWL
jgi:hypothetical protein